jgi:hypothetical protein
MSSSIRDKKQQPLVRIDSADKAILDKLSMKTGESTPRLLHRAVTQLKKAIFFEQMNGAYRGLRANSEEWQLEKDERALYDNSLSDGLTDLA